MESEQKGKGLITLSIIMILIIAWDLPVSEFTFGGYKFGLTKEEFIIGWFCLFCFFLWRYLLRVNEMWIEYKYHFFTITQKKLVAHSHNYLFHNLMLQEGTYEIQTHSVL